MITFFISIFLLVIGYFIYGTFVEKVFHPDDRETPCIRHPDGVDFVPIKKRRAFCILWSNVSRRNYSSNMGSCWNSVLL